LNDQGSGSMPTELDVYGGNKGGIGGDFSYDVGVLAYVYPGTRNAGAATPNTTEVYGSVGYSWASFKCSYSLGNLFGWTGSHNQNSHGSTYYDLSASPTLADGWTLQAHIGRQNVAHRDTASYTDWRLGVNKDVGFGTLGVGYTSTNAKGKAGEDYANPYGVDMGRGRLAVSFSKTM
jgi:uncharacterized protein (TIGR02001 family)